MIATYNEAAFEKMAQSIKLAAMVDELVEIACETKEAALVMGFADALTAEHEQMLKEAFGWADVKGAVGAAGSALKGGAQKAVGAVQNMGAGGAARRMAAAGQQHDVLQNMTKPTAFRAAPTAAQAQAAMPAMQRGIDPSAARMGAKYQPQQVAKGLEAQDLARSHADIAASTPRPVSPGQVRYNPQDVTGGGVTVPVRRFTPPPAAIPAMGTVHQLPRPIPAMREAA
jgi:hypothetical protein